MTGETGLPADARPASNCAGLKQRTAVATMSPAITAIRASNRFRASRTMAANEIETSDRTTQSRVRKNLASIDDHCAIRVFIVPAHPARTGWVSQTPQSQSHTRPCIGAVRCSA